MATGSATDKLAIEGGAPVRDVSKDPWPVWPANTEEEWRVRAEPALRKVYLSGAEGLVNPRREEFERAFARYCGAGHAALVNNGTNAISAAVAATLDLDGLGDGGEVIVPNYTYIATAGAPLFLGCSLAFVDIHPESFTLDPSAVEDAITERTVAILPVHVGGHPADMDALNAIAGRRGLAVIEDCAQAHGAQHKGRPVGVIGDAGAFSFQSTKNLTSGEGGAVVTDDEEVHERVIDLIDGGRRRGGGRWEYPRLGWNLRPSAYLAALLTVRMESLEEQTESRTRSTGYLSGELSKIGGIAPPTLMPWATRHAFHLFSITYDPEAFGGLSRDSFVRALVAEGVPCMNGYTPLSESPAMRSIAGRYPGRVRTHPCPTVESVSESSVWLLQELFLGDRKDMDCIVEAVAKIKRAFTG
jgi:dTDP-4-amino-4,6-dideoxygalactose transaminase